MLEVIELPIEFARFALPGAVQERLQTLLGRQDAGEDRSPDERREAEGLIEMAENLMTNRWMRQALMATIGCAALLLAGILATLPQDDSVTRSGAPSRSSNHSTESLSGTATPIPASTVTSVPLSPWISEHDAIDIVMTYIGQAELVVHEWAARRLNEVEVARYTGISPAIPDPSKQFWMVVLKVPADSLEHEDITGGAAPSMPTNTAYPRTGDGIETEIPVHFSGNMNIDPDSALVDEDGLAGLYYVMSAVDGLLTSRGLINPIYFTYEEIEALAPDPTPAPVLIIP